MKPKILSCGCWQCRKCIGIGSSDKKDANGLYQLCEDCSGQGTVKSCPEHAKEDGFDTDWRSGK